MGLKSGVWPAFPVEVGDPGGRAGLLEALPQFHATASLLLVRLIGGKQGCHNRYFLCIIRWQPCFPLESRVARIIMSKVSSDVNPAHLHAVPEAVPGIVADRSLGFVQELLALLLLRFELLLGRHPVTMIKYGEKIDMI